MVRLTLPVLEQKRRRVSLFLPTLSLVFALVGSLRLWSSENTIVWKATILTSEFGQWLALIPLALAALILGRLLSRTELRRRRELLAAAAGFIVSFGLFIAPAAEFASQTSTWSKQLEDAFGNAQKPAAAIGLASLFLGGPRVEAVAPQELTFKTDDDQDLKLLFYPARGTAHAPWLVVVHGGGWDSGDRYQLPELNSVLATHGVSVVSVDYRLAPAYTWPAPRDDVRHAVDFIKENAASLGVDANRWAILGRSAGGQIAEAVAYQSADPTLKGCIALYAPSDLLFAYQFGREDDILSSRSLLREYLGGDPEKKAAAYADASPLNFVSPSAPPTLLFHGPRDPLVWSRHSERLIAKLKENNVRSALIEIPWATHAFDYSLSGPGGQLSTVAIEYFLKAVFQ